jgi:hypothetical protein
MKNKNKHSRKVRSSSFLDKKRKWKIPIGFMSAKDKFEVQGGSLSFIRYVKNFTDVDIADKNIIACFYYLDDKYNTILIKIELPFEKDKAKIFRYSIQLNIEKYIGIKNTILDKEKNSCKNINIKIDIDQLEKIIKDSSKRKSGFFGSRSCLV